MLLSEISNFFSSECQPNLNFMLIFDGKSHREFRLRNGRAKHVSGKNICWSTLTAKSRGGKIFEFLHCPFEGRANMHHKIQPNWLTGRCCLAGGSKGQWRKSKLFLFLLLPMKVDQYIFFPETCFASTISEPEFTV